MAASNGCGCELNHVFETESSTRPIATHFHATCPAAGMYLLVSDQARTARILAQMEPLGDRDGNWELTLKLAPGAYRYRYYAFDGRLTTYLSPRDVEDGRVHMVGLDAVLTVPAESAPQSDRAEQADQAARLRWLFRNAGERLTRRADAAPRT